MVPCSPRKMSTDRNHKMREDVANLFPTTINVSLTIIPLPSLRLSFRNPSQASAGEGEGCATRRLPSGSTRTADGQILLFEDPLVLALRNTVAVEDNAHRGELVDARKGVEGSLERDGYR